MNKIELKNKLEKVQKEISELTTQTSDIINTVSMNKAMQNILKILGTASRANRCFVWENYFREGISLPFMKQIYEWVEGVEAVQDSEIIDHVIYEPDIYDLLSSGNSLNAIVKDLDDYTRGILEAQGIKSILLVPVHIDNNFWGFIGFDNCHSEELWEPFEEEILKSASLTIAQMIDKFKKI